MTTNKQNLEQVIKDYIMREFLAGEDPSQLTTTTPLLTTGVLDSIATLKLVGFLEQEFAISVAAHETDSEYLDTIDSIARLVQSKQS
jgi:acyl carrier protein